MNTFSSSGKNSSICLFGVAWKSTGNTIVSTYGFFLNSDIGINPGLFRRGEWGRGRIYPWLGECREQTCQITVHISALVARDEGPQWLSPMSQFTPQPPVTGYSVADLSLPALFSSAWRLLWYKHESILISWTSASVWPMEWLRGSFSHFSVDKLYLAVLITRAGHNWSVLPLHKTCFFPRNARLQ